MCKPLALHLRCQKGRGYGSGWVWFRVRVTSRVRVRVRVSGFWAEQNPFFPPVKDRPVVYGLYSLIQICVECDMDAPAGVGHHPMAGGAGAYHSVRGGSFCVRMDWPIVRTDASSQWRGLTARRGTVRQASTPAPRGLGQGMGADHRVFAGGTI